MSRLARLVACLALGIGLAACLYFHSAAASPSPVGLWRSFDDRTGEARGLIRIYEVDGTLHGKVEQIFIPADRGRVCERCTDDRRGKPILGMDIFRDLRPEGDGWAGHILDPQTGNIYTCTGHLAQNGQEFVLRGYILVTLLGRSQTWQRADAR